MPPYQIIVETDPPRGDLFELEQTTWYRVLDARTGAVVLTFRSHMEARLSREDGMWSDHRFAGVSDVTLAPDGRSVLVHYGDGHSESVPLPD